MAPPAAAPAPAAPGAPAPQAAPKAAGPLPVRPGMVIPHAQVGNVPPNTRLTYTPQGFVVQGVGDVQAQGGFRNGPDVVTPADEQFADQTRGDQLPFYDPRKMLLNLKRGPGVF